MNTSNANTSATATNTSIEPLTYDFMNQNTFDENQSQVQHYSIINMNDNTQYDGYAILPNNVTTTVQNQNNVFSYVDLYPEPLVNLENNTFVDNNDPNLENVYVMMNVQQQEQQQQHHQQSNDGDINNINNNINNQNQEYTINYLNNAIVDFNNLNIPIPELVRSYNEM